MDRIRQPNARLLSAEGYIRQNAAVADVGTDHAYLPIWLMQTGRIRRAIACDIGVGPLERAIRNISESGLSDRIQTMQTDGLHGVESFQPDHITVFGMGGELICKILSEADWVKSPQIRLILQPMTHADVLRKYLWENGFRIVGETLTEDDGRIYQTLCAEWHNECTDFVPVDCLVGKEETRSASPLDRAFLLRELHTQQKIIKGRSQAKEQDVATHLELLNALEQRLHKTGEST